MLEHKFTHKGYAVRIRGYDESTYRFYITTDSGPVFGMAVDNAFTARRRAIEYIARRVEHDTRDSRSG